MDGWLMMIINKIGKAEITCNIQTFTDKALRKYFCEVEFILNKRPLTPISDDIHDFETITPNHLLKGYQNNKNSYANPTHYIKGLQNHYKTVQYCANML